MKNDYIARRNADRLECFRAGLDSGRQQMLDFIVLVLNDPKYMGKDVFGKARLLKCVEGIKDMMEEYDTAFQKQPETDYWQELMDAKLAKAFGVYKLEADFTQRYPHAARFDYERGRWN